MNEARRHDRSARHSTGRFVIGLSVLTLAAVPARRARPPRLEATAFAAVNGLPDGLHRPMWPIMQGGSLAAVPVVALALHATGQDAAAARVAVGGFAAWALAKGAKQIVGRGRPDGLVDVLQVRGRAQTGRGFPSGHAAVAVAIAAGIVSAVPWTRAPLAALAATVCLSRVYVGAHLPLDVVGGAGLGLVISGGLGAITREQPGCPRRGIRGFRAL